ncbi:MAG: hypothetical protein FD169_2468 [Bacillota bacterium]|nr:MAG: hypothetical protein FD169_2468 [Bacillota bacterium]MBS3949482.1 hypothetical protein [Peptococcaceae bacterium]
MSAKPVSIKGIDLVCPVCGGKDFYQRQTLLNTAGATFLGFDWANANADNYVCSHCFYMFWFHPENHNFND